MVAHPPKEKRKVQISGKSSCMISLPKRWVKEMELTQGSLLAITRHSSTSLLISADSNLVSKPSTGEEVVTLYVPVPEAPEATVRKIACLYVQGYNLIKVKLGDNPLNSLNKTAIREHVRRLLIGVEIVSDSSDGLLLQILLGKSELSIENALKRMSIVSSTMLEDAVSSLRSLDRRRAHDVIEKDEIQRFGFYASRQILGTISHDLFKDGGDMLEPADLTVYLQVSKSIQYIADCARDIAQKATLLESPPSDNAVEYITRMSEFASEIFDAAVLSFFKKDSKAAERTIERSKNLVMLEREISSSTKGRMSTENVAQTFTIAGAVSSLARIIHFSRDMAELVLYLTSEQYVTVNNGTGSRSASMLLKETPVLQSSPSHSAE